MNKHIPEILYEDNHLIIVNKPYNVLAQGDETGDSTIGDSVKTYIKEKYQKLGEVFLGIVHRIDRPVSGVLIMARTSKALERMSQQFKDKGVKKTYWAVTKNKPQQHTGTLTHYLWKDAKQRKSFAYTQPYKEAKLCTLDYRLLLSSDNYHLLEINPHTGRHHQIRVQLSSMGCPIKGDIKYGAERTNKDGNIHLHAREVTFLHPVKKEWITVTAPVPDEALWKWFETRVYETPLF